MTEKNNILYQGITKDGKTIMLFSRTDDKKTTWGVSVSDEHVVRMFEDEQTATECLQDRLKRSVAPSAAVLAPPSEEVLKNISQDQAAKRAREIAKKRGQKGRFSSKLGDLAKFRS